MTTPYKLEKIWSGETVLIVGNAPGLTAKDIASAARHCKIIAVNRAISKVPHADMLVSIDGNWPKPEGDHFEGLRVVGVESAALDALYVNLPHEVVTLGPGHVVHLRNNALFAMRIAVKMGAKKLLLLGFDPEHYEALHNFPGFQLGLDQLVGELEEQGIEIVHLD